MKKIEVVAGVISYDNKILCCQRQINKLKYLSKKWEFPGGKIEFGETQKVALIREIKEELDINITDLQFMLSVTHSYPDFDLIMHVYSAKANRLNYTLEAHYDAKWVEKNKLNTFDWAAADIPIVEYIMS